MASYSQVKPHAVLTPVPIQAHMMSMLKLAKVHHHRGFHITYVNTRFNHRRLLKSWGPNALDGLPDCRFETIPDGPVSDDDSIEDIPSLFDPISKNYPLSSLLPETSCRLNNEALSSNTTNGPVIPPVTCFVSDAHMTFTIKAAQ